MAYDAARKRTMLFGEHPGTGLPFNVSAGLAIEIVHMGIELVESHEVAAPERSPTFLDGGKLRGSRGVCAKRARSHQNLARPGLRHSSDA